MTKRLANICHASDGQQCVLQECCFLEMFELIVQTGAMNKMESRNRKYMMYEELNFITSEYSVHIRSGCSTILQRFARVVKMGWIHCTSKADRNSLEMCVKGLAHNETSDYTRAIAEELYEFMQNA